MISILTISAAMVILLIVYLRIRQRLCRLRNQRPEPAMGRIVAIACMPALYDVVCVLHSGHQVHDAVDPLVVNAKTFTPRKLPNMPLTKTSAFKCQLCDVQRQLRVSSRTLSRITVDRQGQTCHPAGKTLLLYRPGMRHSAAR